MSTADGFGDARRALSEAVTGDIPGGFELDERETARDRWRAAR